VRVLDPQGVPRALLCSAAALHRRHLAWDDAIRTPVAAVRRIGVVHLAAGAGATTLAREMVRVAVARRPGPVLAVDLADTGALAGRLGVTGTTSLGGRMLVSTSAQAHEAAHRIGPAAWAVRPDAAGGARAAWARDVAPVVRFHEIALTDFGRRDPERNLDELVALCDAVCLVAPAQRGPAEAARAVAEAIEAIPEHPLTAIALIDRHRAARGVPRAVQAHTRLPVVVVPHDPGLERGGAARHLGTRRALLRLAALLIAGPSSSEDAA
jgi:hypothetical protein